MATSISNTWSKGPSTGASASPSTLKEAPAESGVGRLDVAECLKYVIDPEVGINIVDLGLVYDIQLDLPRVSLVLSMTTPACPLSGHISNHARAVLAPGRGHDDVELRIILQPPGFPVLT